MPDRNHFELDCRMTKDMDIRTTKSGKNIASFDVCFNESYQKDGSWVKFPHFFSCTAFGAAANLMFHKGELVHIEGCLSQDTWEREGKKQSKVVLKVFKIEPLGNNNRSTGNDAPSNPRPSPAPAKAEATASDDSDIPF